MKIFNNPFKPKPQDYLDLTQNPIYSSKFARYLGFSIITRPYKKWALFIAILIIFTAIIPINNLLVTIPLASKFLGRYG